MQNYDGPIIERAATVTADGKRRKLYPQRLDGHYSKQRRLLAWVLILIYFAMPWITVGGRPLIRFDLTDDVLYFFGMVYRFNDIVNLAFFLILFALGISLFTSLKGRVWCGYACPQTVYLDFVIRPIEEFFEGNAARRAHRDKNPSFENSLRKVAKHLAFLAVSAIVANNFLGFFYDPRLILEWMQASPASHPVPFTVMTLVLGTFYWDLAWFREQFCSFVCPYARIQSALMDDRTPGVVYDFNRGEPRGRKGPDLGDCIDCGLCTRVCPTGIDIRNGPQLECIQCARCVDACDLIMTNLKRPKGLIRFGRLVEVTGKAAAGLGTRLRPLIYGLIMAIIIGLMTYKVINRAAVEVTITRSPGTTVGRLQDGRYTNVFVIRMFNTGDRPASFSLSSADPKISVECGACAVPLKAFEERQGMIIIKFSNTGGEQQTISLRLSHPERHMQLPLLRPGNSPHGVH